METMVHKVCDTNLMFGSLDNWHEYVFQNKWYTYDFVDADLNGYLAVWSGDITRQNKHLADHTMKRKQLRSQSS